MLRLLRQIALRFAACVIGVWWHGRRVNESPVCNSVFYVWLDSHRETVPVAQPDELPPVQVCQIDTRRLPRRRRRQGFKETVWVFNCIAQQIVEDTGRVRVISRHHGNLPALGFSGPPILPEHPYYLLAGGAVPLATEEIPEHHRKQ